MTPLSLLGTQKLASLLKSANGVDAQLALLAQSGNIQMPAKPAAQIVLSSASPDIGDKDIQLTYPRICLYSSGLKNNQFEKFRSFSGTLAVNVDVWASANLVDQTDEWIHYYVEAVRQVLRSNVGDWGDGVLFPGQYDVQLQPPKSGGLGYVQSARITCALTVTEG